MDFAEGIRFADRGATLVLPARPMALADDATVLPPPTDTMSFSDLRKTKIC